MSTEVRAALIIIGNEVLSGRTQDANLQYLALGLNDVGVHLKEVRVIPDDEGEIIATVNAMRAKFDYVFTTGGIGPTHDDITSDCVAKAFGVPLLRNPRAVALLQKVIKPENLNEARLRMANIPEGADLVEGAGEGDEAVPRDETVGRLDTDDAAEGGRLTNRTTGVRAE